MEEIIKNALTGPLMSEGLVINAVKYEFDKEEKSNVLYVTINSLENDIDLENIVKATKIINPIIDQLDIITDEYILDVSSEEKGEN